MDYGVWHQAEKMLILYYDVMTLPCFLVSFATTKKGLHRDLNDNYN